MENGLQKYNTTYNTGKSITNIQHHIQHWKRDSKYTIPHTTMENGLQIYNTTYNTGKRIPNIQYHRQQ